MATSPFDPVVLTGERVQLVPLALDHAAGLAAAWEPGTMDLFGTSDAPDPVDEPSAEAWIRSVLAERAAGARVPFTVLDRGTGAVLGTSSYLRIDPAIPRLEVGGTWYAPHARGTHVNPEAKLLLLGHAFEALDTHCVLLLTSAWNERSQRAIQRLGAVRDGVVRAERRQRDGRIRDTVSYSILVDEWPRVRAGLERRLGLRAAPEPLDVDVRLATAADAHALTDYLARNAEHLAPFVPLRPEGYDDLRAVRERLGSPDRIQYLAMHDGRVVGQCAISNVIRAPVFRSCTIGYDVDAHDQGRGVATTMVRHVADAALTTHELHRVEAGTLVHNRASQRVLEHCGFTRIGIAPRHVRIAGEWQDHVLYVRTAEDRMA